MECKFQSLGIFEILTMLSAIASPIIVFWLKNQISKTFESYKIRFTKLHENRAFVIKDLYYLAYDLEEQLGSLIQQGAIIDKEKEEEVKKLRDEFNKCMKRNEIYFTDDDYSGLVKFKKLCDGALYKIHELSERAQTKRWTVEDEGEYATLNGKINNHSKSILSNLRNIFRSILGVNLE